MMYASRVCARPIHVLRTAVAAVTSPTIWPRTDVNWGHGAVAVSVRAAGRTTASPCPAPGARSARGAAARPCSRSAGRGRMCRRSGLAARAPKSPARQEGGREIQGLVEVVACTRLPLGKRAPGGRGGLERLTWKARTASRSLAVRIAHSKSSPASSAALAHAPLAGGGASAASGCARSAVMGGGRSSPGGRHNADAATPSTRPNQGLPARAGPPRPPRVRGRSSSMTSTVVAAAADTVPTLPSACRYRPFVRKKAKANRSLPPAPPASSAAQPASAPSAAWASRHSQPAASSASPASSANEAASVASAGVRGTRMHVPRACSMRRLLCSCACLVPTARTCCMCMNAASPSMQPWMHIAGT